MSNAEPLEIEELDGAAAWRLRLVDADPADSVSAHAAVRLERLAADLRRHDHDPDYAALWTELRSLSNWLAESDLISDYAELAAEYRGRIGVTEMPSDGAVYLRGLLAMARSLL